MLDYTPSGVFQADTGERVYRTRKFKPTVQLGVAYVIAPRGVGQGAVMRWAAQEMSRRFATNHYVISAHRSAYPTQHLGVDWWTVPTQVPNDEDSVTGVVQIAPAHIGAAQSARAITELEHGPLTLVRELHARVPAPKARPRPQRRDDPWLVTHGVAAAGGIVDDTHVLTGEADASWALSVIWPRGTVHHAMCGPSRKNSFVGSGPMPVWAVAQRVHVAQLLGLVSLLGLSPCPRCKPFGRDLTLNPPRYDVLAV